MFVSPSSPKSGRWLAALAGASLSWMVSVGTALAEDAYQPVFGPAIDWSILASLAETFALESNRQLNGVNEAVEARGSVRVGLSANGAGKRTRFGFNTGFTVGRSTDDEISNLNRLDPNLSASAVFLGKGYSVNASLLARTRATSASELEDSGITTTNATRFDANASLGVSWQASKRDSLSLSVRTQIVDFSRSVNAFTPSRSIGLNGGWSHQATPTTSYSFSSSFTHFESDGVNGRVSRSISSTVGIQHSRTSRHNLGGSAGLNFVSTDLRNGGSSTQIGFVGSGSFRYQIDEFSAGLSINQNIQPSSDGDLNAFTSLSGNLSYRIDALQNVGFSITYSRRSNISGGGDVLQFLSLGPSYNYSLSEDSSLSLAYQFRVRDDAANDLETGHQLMLSLSHQLTLLQ